jgi:hypothetical protein
VTGVRFAGLAIGACVALFVSRYAAADETDARNFLTVATGSVPSSNDPRISIVQRQLEMIERYCAATSSGPGIHDKLGYAHSQLQVQQSQMAMLADFVRIARAQCSQMNSSALVTLYVLERNSGTSHSATVERLTKNPKGLLAKWKSR